MIVRTFERVDDRSQWACTELKIKRFEDSHHLQRAWETAYLEKGQAANLRESSLWMLSSGNVRKRTTLRAKGN